MIAIGPESAGSVPGPVRYGRGGTPPTVTDAARAVTISCGKAPRHFALVSFGGAGPVHGARLARMLGCPKLVFPRASGGESALGLLMAQTSLDFARTQVLTLGLAVPEPIDALFADLRSRGRRQPADSGVPAERQRFAASCDMRFAAQGYEIAVELPPPPYADSDLPVLREASFAAHAKAYCDGTFERDWPVVGVHRRRRPKFTGSPCETISPWIKRERQPCVTRDAPRTCSASNGSCKAPRSPAPIRSNVATRKSGVDPKRSASFPMTAPSFASSAC